MNTYAYVGGNPLYWVDTLGLSEEEAGGYTIPTPIPIPPSTTSDGWDIEYTWDLPFDLPFYCTGTGLCLPKGMMNEDGNNEKGESCPSNDPDNWEKIPRSRPPAYRPKGKKEPVFQGDRAGDRSHGGSRWKKWDKYRDWKDRKPRTGTYDANGNRIRR